MIPRVNRSRKPLGDEDRAALEQMREPVMEKLNRAGLTAAWLSERTGVSALKCGTWLKELGAYKHGGFGVTMYRIASLTRKQSAMP